jgi:hypothetical protein
MNLLSLILRSAFNLLEKPNVLLFQADKMELFEYTLAKYTFTPIFYKF